MNVYFKHEGDILELLLEFEGDYNLNFDVELGLYYIERKFCNL